MTHRSRRTSTTRRRTVALAAVATSGLLLTAMPATADIAPEDLAWITAAGVDADFTGDIMSWDRAVTVRTTQPLPGRPGNRHSATVNVFAEGVRPVPFRLDLLDEQCETPSGPCVPVWRGMAWVPRSAGTVTGPGAAGEVRVSLPVPASTVMTVAPEGAPVPVGDTRIDVTLTPTDWRDLREDPDLRNATDVSRVRDSNVDIVQAIGEASGTGLAADGVIADVPADTVTGASWHDMVSSRAELGPGFPPLRTRAQMEPFAPPVRRGRLVEPTVITYDWGGLVRGRLTTSTGFLLPGNAFQVYVPFRVDAAPGDSLTGRLTEEYVTIQAYDCPTPTTRLDACTEAGTFAGVGPARWTADRFGAATLDADLAIRVDDQHGQERGRMRATLALAPAGPGEAVRDGSIYRGPAGGTWTTRSALVRPVTGRFRLGGRTAVPDTEPVRVTLLRVRSGEL